MFLLWLSIQKGVLCVKGKLSQPVVSRDDAIPGRCGGMPHLPGAATLSSAGLGERLED